MTSVTLLLALLLRLNPLPVESVANPPISCRNNVSSPVPAVEQFRALRTEKAVTLQWSVSGNEEASLFRLEKSADGSHYRTAALVFGTDNTRTEIYSYNDMPVKGRIYYRVVVETKDRSVIVGKPIGVDDKTPANTTHE